MLPSFCPSFCAFYCRTAQGSLTQPCFATHFFGAPLLLTCMINITAFGVIALVSVCGKLGMTWSAAAGQAGADEAWDAAAAACSTLP